MEDTLQRSNNLTISDLMQGAIPKVKEFLDSVSRNSKNTQMTYASGLVAFHKFLDMEYTLESIIDSIKKGQTDVYVTLNQFVSFLMQYKHYKTHSIVSQNTLNIYMAAVRSYLQFYDVDIASNRFKRKVKMPKIYREDEEALDAADIRKIMLSCNNRRLKPYLLILASAGLRAVEACAIRVCDIDYTSSPTKIHIRREYTKTKVARDVYISDEATTFLKQWLDWKYRERKYPTKQQVRQETDLVFTHLQNTKHPRAFYYKIQREFSKVLKTVGLEKRKEGILRRTITLHSFRRYVKTVISDQVSQDYSEWFLGHAKSPYYTMKEPMRREIYATKCMKYLTFLDYSALESRGKNIEAQLEESREETSRLRQEVRSYAPLIGQIEELRKRVDELVAKAKGS